MFYGCEHSDLKPTNGEFAFVGSLGGLYRLLAAGDLRTTAT